MLLRQARWWCAAAHSSGRSVVWRATITSSTTSAKIISIRNSSRQLSTTAAAIHPPPSFQQAAHVSSEQQYKTMWEQSVKDPDRFWGEIAKNNFSWFEPFSSVTGGSFSKLPVTWFANGKLNITVNALDRHIETRGDKVAITFEGDNGQVQTLTYKQLLDQVCRMANLLRSHGVKKGDTITIFMPMTPELAVSVLACARVGAVHSVVFSGFSAQGLATRIVDAKSSIIITADVSVRGGKTLAVKSIADEAVGLAAKEGVHVRTMFLAKNSTHDESKGPKQLFDKNRDVWLTEALPSQSTTCKPEVMDAEDPLFILYTSGSTGKPKGVLHTQAGYMVYAATTFKYLFDIKPDTDVHFCTADIGWVTGHSYILYGPLCNGAHTLMFEGIPTYPHPGRFWEIIDKHKVTIFYTAPTALRSLMVYGNDPVRKYSRSSLRLLGSVGEPINEAAWRWFHNVVGDGRCPIVDTWWQTETGGVLISPFPGAISTKPGMAMTPFFGVDPVIVDAEGKAVPPGTPGQLCIKQAWPGVMRTLFNDADRYVSSYFSDFPGLYFTGDGAVQDADGHYGIIGRLDDVMNISGHRISTVEIESAICKHPVVAEVAAVSVKHDIKGEALYCYVTLREGNKESPELLKAIRDVVRTQIGPIAVPDFVHFTRNLPKTRSGKIMRRILRKIANNDITDLGDTSTLADPATIPRLVETRKNRGEQ